VTDITRIAQGDTITIVPEQGPERVVVVTHVEHHVILLADHPEFPAEGGDGS
jgi:hypothetical protein